jgi:hypothetical protein
VSFLQLIDGTLVTNDLPAYIEALKEPKDPDKDQQIIDTPAIGQVPSSPLANQSTSATTPDEAPTMAVSALPLSETRAASKAVAHGSQASERVVKAKVNDAVSSESEARNLVMARTQTAKLKTVCKNMENFEHWLHEQHIPLSDVERGMLEEHKTLAQKILQKC